MIKKYMFLSIALLFSQINYSDGAEKYHEQTRKEYEIFQAIERGDFGELSTLVTTAADANASNAVDRTALMIAAERGNSAIIKKLLGEGANINARDVLGDTALMYAIRSGDPDVVEQLLRAGIDIKLKDTEGNTALRLAKQLFDVAEEDKKQVEAGKFVGRGKVNLSKVMERAEQNYSKQWLILQELLRHGANY